jgi:hypothetical protein
MEGANSKGSWIAEKMMNVIVKRLFFKTIIDHYQRDRTGLKHIFLRHSFQAASCLWRKFFCLRSFSRNYFISIS